MSGLFGGGPTTTIGNQTSTGSNTTTGSSTSTGTSTGGSSSTGNTAGTSTGQYQLPEWLDQSSQTLAAMIPGLAGRPYTPYTGAFSAPLSSNQQAGIGQAGQTPWSGSLNSATSSLGRAGLTIPQANLQPYMNPYTQYALNPQLDYMKTQFVGQNNQLKDQAAGSGAFGGSRPSLMQSQAQFNQNKSLGDFEGQGLAAAFNSGTGLFEQDQNRQLQQASGYMQAAGLQQAGQQQQYGQLMGSGAVQRGVNQDQLNAQYQEFLRGQNFPMQQAQGAAGILSQLPHGYTQSGNTTGTQNQTGTQFGNTTGTQNSTGTNNTTDSSSGTKTETPPPPNELGQMLGAGMDALAIAQHLGVTPSVVAGWIRDLMGGGGGNGSVDMTNFGSPDGGSNFGLNDPTVFSGDGPNYGGDLPGASIGLNPAVDTGFDYSNYGGGGGGQFTTPSDPGQFDFYNNGSYGDPSLYTDLSGYGAPPAGG